MAAPPPSNRIIEDSKSYNKVLYSELGAEEHSNEAILQFGFNVEKSSASKNPGRMSRTAITQAERANIMRNPYARRVMKQLKLFRKWKVLYGIVHDYLRDDQFARWFYLGNNVLSFVRDDDKNDSSEILVLDHHSMPSNSSPLCKWFQEFLRNLTNERVDTDLADMENQYDLIATYLDNPEYQSRNDLRDKIKNMALQSCLKYKGRPPGVKYGDDEGFLDPTQSFVDLVNYLCIAYAKIHYISFAVIKNTPNQFDAKQTENRFSLPARNKESKKHHAQNKNKQYRQWDLRAIVVNNVIYGEMNEGRLSNGKNSSSTAVELPASALFNIENALFHNTAGVAGRDYDEHEEEPEAEPGWEELAREVLPKNGLNPANYGLDPITPTSSAASTPVTPTIHEEGESENERLTETPPLHLTSTYESLSTNIHDHPIVDTSDVLDSVEDGVREYEEEEVDLVPQIGQFMVPPEAFTSVILELSAPNIVTAFNSPPASSTAEDVSETGDDIAPPREDTPPIHFPSISEVLMRGDRDEAPRGPVHVNPAHCDAIAERFVNAWRAAKRHAYKHKKFRHFPINRSFFKAGHVCHRCYQLVRAHHEEYHKKGGATVDHKVWRYPRGRRAKQMAKIAPPNKDSREYTASRNEAKKMAKKYESLLDRSSRHTARFGKKKKHKR